MNKRKSSFSGLGAPFKKPRQRAGAALYNTFARAGGMASGRRTGGFRNPTLPSSSELKFKDNTTTLTLASGAATFVNVTTAAGAGASQLLNGLVPDSTATGRNGRRVVIKSLYIRANAQLGATSTFGAPIRMLVVYDKQANATAPAITDMLATDSFVSQNNISNRDRFVTLCDQVMDPIGTSGDFARSLVVYKKLNLPVQFNAGTAGTIGDITSGSIYITFSQAGGIGTAGPSVTYYARVRYSDN